MHWPTYAYLSTITIVTYLVLSLYWALTNTQVVHTVTYLHIYFVYLLWNNYCILLSHLHDSAACKCSSARWACLLFEAVFQIKHCGCWIQGTCSSVVVRERLFTICLRQFTFPDGTAYWIQQLGTIISSLKCPLKLKIFGCNDGLKY